MLYSLLQIDLHGASAPLPRGRGVRGRSCDRAWRERSRPASRVSCRVVRVARVTAEPVNGGVSLTLPTYRGSFPVYSSSTKNWFHTQLRLCLCRTSRGPGSERGDFSRSLEPGIGPQQLPHSHRGNASARRARALPTPEQRHPIIWAWACARNALRSKD